MAYLVQCPVCKHDISNEATNCPHCGDPQYKYVTKKTQDFYGPSEWLKCKECNGKGEHPYRGWNGNGTHPSYVRCGFCDGKGEIWGRPCETKSIIHDVRLRK